MMDTHWEKRIAALEKELGETCAAAEGYRLALEEAKRQIAELSRLHVSGPAIPKSVSPAGPTAKNAGPTGERDIQPKGRKNRG
jgi:hypothetical protein